MINDKPVTRKERFLAGAAGEDITLDTPITREERFLAKAAGMDVKTDDPVTRSEKYLAKIAEGGGGGSPVPEYEGAYTVTPSEQTQTLATKDKKTTANITVNPIPSSYIVPTGTKQITQNGTGIDVAAYADVDVNVPSVTPTGTIQITQNGQVDVTQYATADVNVSGGGGEPPQPALDSHCGLFLIEVPYSGFGITLRLIEARGATVDWGDGTADTSSSSAFTISHIYSEKGFYWIKVVASSIAFLGTAKATYQTIQPAIDGFGDTTGLEAKRSIRKILIKGISVGVQALQSMAGAIKIQVDARCSDMALYGAQLAKELVIGSSFSYGGSSQYDFAYYQSLTEMIFLNPTCIAVDSSDCFSNLYSNCKIYVPFASLAAYLTATNYPAPATYTYIGFATYESGATLPTQDATQAYNVVWYASKADAIAQTNPITVGNGSEIYCRYTAI